MWALVVYFALLIFLGFRQARKSRDFEGYFYGGRRLSAFWVFFTVTASWFGAAATLATVEAAVQNGFRAAWLLGIPTVLTILLFIVLNRRIRNTQFVSLPLFLNQYYGKRVGGFASFLIFVYMVILAASQLVAWGRFVGHFIGQNYQWTILAGALIVIIYSYIGGYLSVVRTDGLQLLLLAGALVFLARFFKEGLFAFRPQDFRMFVEPDYHLLMTVSFTLAWVISPIVWQRMASARSARASRQGLWLSMAVFSILYVTVILIGIGLRDMSSPVGFGAIVKECLPLGGSLLVFIGLAAAIMSTTDTALNLGALTLVKDVLNIQNPQRTILWARLSTFICGLLAVLLALRFQSIIQTLGLASEIMAEGLFIPGLAALLFKKRLPLAGFLSLCLGGGFALLVFVNAYGLGLPLPAWPYSLPYGLGLSLLGFISGILFQPVLRRPEVGSKQKKVEKGGKRIIL